MRWRIGDWIVCSDTDTIRCGDAQRKLERRAMETLAFLARRAGQVVTKEALIEAVWGRLAVSDHSVAMVISQLRRAFDDDVRAPKFIETITKRGYRLVASCAEIGDTVPAAPARRLPSAVEAHSHAIALSAGIAIGAIGALSAFALF